MKKNHNILLALVFATVCMPLAADPIAFSVNSDSGTPDEDSLYEIDLELGTYSLIDKIPLPTSDIEGLALDAANTLYAFNDESRTLFTLNKQSAVPDKGEVLSDLPIGGGNDVGMTFACDGTLYMTSVATNRLYRVILSGDLEEIGPLGADINISGIAAYGNPARLYGLGNGNTDSPKLYEIDIESGAATPVGTLGAMAEPYNEGGLDFDASGQLWAITDRRIPDNLGSQVLKIDIDRNSDMVVDAKTLAEIGFESLAVAPPAACDVLIEVPGEEPGQSPLLGRTAGVPLLGPSGLLTTTLLLLLTGLLASRRF